MDKLSETRQRKVREIIRDDFEGRQVDFADRIERPDNYVSRVVSNGENRKGVGERMARHIERRCGKPKGWLDGDVAGDRVEDSKAVTLYGIQVSEDGARLGAEWDKLDEPRRTVYREMIELAVAQQKREGTYPPSRRPRQRKDDDQHPGPT